MSDSTQSPAPASLSVQPLLGYLNFSEGRPDPRFQKQLNDAFAFLAAQGEARPCDCLRDTLLAELERLRQAGSAAFQDATQAEAVLRLALGELLTAYRAHHADLLFHQRDADLFQPYFLARACEAVLAQRGPWDDTQRIVAQGAAAAQRFRRLSPHRGAGGPTARRAVSARARSTGAIDAARRRHRGRQISGGAGASAGDPGSDRSGHPRRGGFRSRAARRVRVRSARLRLRPSRGQAAQLLLRRMGSAPSRQPGPLSSLCRPPGHARRAARPADGRDRSRSGRGAVRGRRRARRDRADGGRRHGERAAGARLIGHPFDPGAAHRALPRGVLRPAPGQGAGSARGTAAAGSADRASRSGPPAGTSIRRSPISGRCKCSSGISRSCSRTSAIPRRAGGRHRASPWRRCACSPRRTFC